MFDWEAILKGGAAVVIFGLPIVIVGNAVQDNHAESRWVLPLILVLLLAFGLGGFITARSTNRYPYTNGAVAALAGFAVIALIATIVRVVDDEPIQYGKLAGTALLAYGCGLTGAVAGARRTPA